MAVIFSPSYPAPLEPLDYPFTHARILHTGVWLTGGTVTASTTDADYFASGPTNILTYERWKPASIPATWEYDEGEDTTADCFCIGAHTVGTTGATVTFEIWTGAAWVEIGETASADNMPIMLLLGEPVTFSKWRIAIDVICEIGVAKAGLAMQMTRPIYGGVEPTHLNRMVEFRQNTSETGEFLGSTKQRVGLMTSHTWQHVDADWVRDTWRPFQVATEGVPFFIAWRPETFTEVVLMNPTQFTTPANMGMVNLMTVGFSGRGHGYD